MRADFKISYIQEDKLGVWVKAIFYRGDFESVQNEKTKEIETVYTRKGVIEAQSFSFPVGTSREEIERSLSSKLADHCDKQGYEAIDTQKRR